MHEKYKLATEGGLAERIDTRAIDSAKLFKHFRDLTEFVATNPSLFDLTEEQVDQLRELRKNSARYIEDVLKKRNVLGHVAEERGETGWTLRGDTDISVADFPELRRTFAGYIDSFRGINGLVSALRV